MLNIWIQIIGTCILAIAGYKAKSLTISGAFGTVIVGSIVSIGLGYAGLFLLGVFFASSSYWSKYKREKKHSLLQKVEKGEQRDIIQVFANGGVATLASLLYIFSETNLAIYIFVGSIAAANADTWASEIGTLSKKKPILLTKLQRVDRGTSGAVSILGTCAGFTGALLISFVSYFLWPEITLQVMIYITLIGFSGNIIDTLLGAYVQVEYICPICKIETEKTIHCSTKTLYHKGFALCNNDAVNFLSILLAAGAGGFLLSFFHG